LDLLFVKVLSNTKILGQIPKFQFTAVCLGDRKDSLHISCLEIQCTCAQ